MAAGVDFEQRGHRPPGPPYGAVSEFKLPASTAMVYVLCFKLVHSIEIRLITKIVGIIVLTPSEQ